MNRIINSSKAESGASIVNTIRKFPLSDWTHDPLPMNAYIENLWNEKVIVVLRATDKRDTRLYDLVGRRGSCNRQKD